MTLLWRLMFITTICLNQFIMAGEIDPLQEIREDLARQEETIIFGILERAQFGKNLRVFEASDEKTSPSLEETSFFSHFLHQTEVLHAGLGRYNARDEHAFTDNLPAPLCNFAQKAWPGIKKKAINLNNEILNKYVDDVLPKIAAKDQEGDYGSAVTCDIALLQAISRRVHFGEFVARAKLAMKGQEFLPLIKAKNAEGIMQKITDLKVEENVLDRVRNKVKTHLAAFSSKKESIDPEVVVSIYRDIIIPLNKQVQVMYILQEQ